MKNLLLLCCSIAALGLSAKGYALPDVDKNLATVNLSKAFSIASKYTSARYVSVHLGSDELGKLAYRFYGYNDDKPIELLIDAQTGKVLPLPSYDQADITKIIQLVQRQYEGVIESIDYEPLESGKGVYLVQLELAEDLTVLEIDANSLKISAVESFPSELMMGDMELAESMSDVNRSHFLGEAERRKRLVDHGSLSLCDR